MEADSSSSTPHPETVGDELRGMTLRELLAELTLTEDRLREQAQASGYGAMPGTERTAALRRRERQLSQELRRRREDEDTTARSPDATG